jgi:hypothetical protein
VHYRTEKYVTSGLEGVLAENLAPEDHVLAEQRREVRVVVSIPGRYSLADSRDAHGERRVFGCRAVNVSAHAIALAGPVSGKVGGRVIAYILHLGRVEGIVSRVFDRGFAMTIRASEEERSKFLTKIEWLAKHKDDQLPDKRANQRFEPANPYSRLLLPDGTVLTCVVMDLSISGAALSAEIVPELRTVVAVGSVIGRVVRHLDGGFSVKFVQLQSRASVEAMVICE